MFLDYLDQRPKQNFIFTLVVKDFYNFPLTGLTIYALSLYYVLQSIGQMSIVGQISQETACYPLRVCVGGTTQPLHELTSSSCLFIRTFPELD